MNMAALLISGPVSGLLIVMSGRSRPSAVLPTDEYLRNFGHAFSIVFMSAMSSATSCQRLKSSFTLKVRSEVGACASGSHGFCAWAAGAGLAAAPLACGGGAGAGLAWPSSPGVANATDASARPAAANHLIGLCRHRYVLPEVQAPT